ncbi:unnamed protein product [Umbelopsis ramanniana]
MKDTESLQEDNLSLQEETAFFQEQSVSLLEETASFQEQSVSLLEETASFQEQIVSLPEEKVFLKDHNTQYALFDDTQKWMLKSGRRVEDVLHEFASKSAHEHLAHSFIINPLDPTWEQVNMFTKEELDEISTYKYRKLPAVPDDLAAFINEFNVKDVRTLRKALWQERDFDVVYDNDKSSDKDWVRNVVHSILMEIERSQLSQEHLESWYISRIWSVFDRCFGDLDAVNVIRGESTSIASGLRKNENRVAASTTAVRRQIMGHRADFIIRKLQTEYACGESGKRYSGEKDTKLLLERDLKLPKMMKDQLLQLFKACDNDEKIVRKLSTVGILQYGLSTSMLSMDCPAGYVCRVSSTPTYRIPTNIKSFPIVLHVIELTWKAKASIRDMINEVESYSFGDDEEPRQPVDFIIKKYRTPSPSLSQKKRLYIPSCVTSPFKKVKIEYLK